MMLVCHKYQVSNSYISTHLFSSRELLVAPELKITGSVPCSRAPELTPKSELCAGHSLIQKQSLIRQCLCIFTQYRLYRHTHTLQTPTQLAHNLPVLQASSDSSITLSSATANGSQERTGAYMLRTIMQMCAKTTLMV